MSHKYDKYRIKKAGAVLIITSVCALSLCSCKGKKDSSSLGRGMEAIGALEYETALDIFAEGAAGGENIQQLKRGEGIALMGLSRYDEACEALEESLHNAGFRVGALERDTNYYLAAAFEKRGEYGSAIEVYDAILALWPKEKTARKLRGCVRLKDGDYEGAIEDFDAAVALDPQDYNNLVDIYNSLDAAGYKDVGSQYLRDAMDRNAETIKGYDKGRIYYLLKDYEQARISLEGVRDTGADAVLYLGLTYEALEDYSYASGVYQGFITSRQGNAMIYNQLGICEMKMGSYADAFQHFSDGLALNDAACRQSLMKNSITAAEYMGDFQKAKSLMNDYLKLYPNDPEAKREQIFLSTR